MPQCAGGGKEAASLAPAGRGRHRVMTILPTIVQDVCE